jgi:hypothetical protein
MPDSGREYLAHIEVTTGCDSTITRGDYIAEAAQPTFWQGHSLTGQSVDKEICNTLVRAVHAFLVAQSRLQ